jgi:hypothetical protein
MRVSVLQLPDVMTPAQRVLARTSFCMRRSARMRCSPAFLHVAVASFRRHAISARDLGTRFE